MPSSLLRRAQARACQPGALPRWWPPAATLFAWCCALALFAAILHAAWLCEDAFITLRSVDNWVNGYGLRWNIAERVQSYTHPLWLLCLTPVYWLTRSP